MTLKFKNGFVYDGFTYGWNKKELYRLPSTSKDNKSYGLKKLDLIDIGFQKGYRIKRQKFTVEQLASRTVEINREVKIIKDSTHIPV